MAVASELSIDLHSSPNVDRNKQQRIGNDTTPSPISPHGEDLFVRRGHLSSVSSGSSEPSLTSEEFYRLANKEGIRLDFGTEEDNLADIFAESLEYNNGVVFDESREISK